MSPGYVLLDILVVKFQFVVYSFPILLLGNGANIGTESVLRDLLCWKKFDIDRLYKCFLHTLIIRINIALVVNFFV